jgi:hypothetical protein
LFLHLLNTAPLPGRKEFSLKEVRGISISLHDSPEKEKLNMEVFSKSNR